MSHSRWANKQRFHAMARDAEIRSRDRERKTQPQPQPPPPLINGVPRPGPEVKR